jgi:hypothetical protein
MNVNKGAVRAEDSIGKEEKRELVCPAAMVASISKKNKKMKGKIQIHLIHNFI